LPDRFSIRRYLEEFLPILEGVLAVREFSDDLSVWQNHEWDAPMLMVESVGARWLGDVPAGVLEREELAAAGQRYRIVEGSGRASMIPPI
jgi:hypothetical protein